MVQSPSTLSDVEHAQAGSSGEHTGHNSNSGERTGQEVSERERTGNSGDNDQDRGGLPSDPYGIETEPPSTEAERAAAQQEIGTPVVTGANLRMLKQTVFAQGPPGAYGEIMRTDTWRRNCTNLIKDLSNDELAECLIGMEANIVCPEYFWPAL